MYELAGCKTSNSILNNFATENTAQKVELVLGPLQGSFLGLILTSIFFSGLSVRECAMEFSDAVELEGV